MSDLPVVSPLPPELLLQHQNITTAEKRKHNKDEKPNRQEQQSPTNENHPHRLWGFHD